MLAHKRESYSGFGGVVLGWKAGTVGFFMGFGGLGLSLIFLMSLDRETPIWFLFSISFAPALLQSFLTFELWPEPWMKASQQFVTRLFLALALASIVLAVIHGMKVDYFFPCVLVLIGAWPCLLAELAERPEPFKQARYTQPEKSADGSLVVKASVAKLAWLIFLVSLMLLISIAAIPSIIGWVGSLLLASLLMLAIYIYRPSANYLRIDQNGIEVVIAGQRRKSRWSDIIGFHVGDVEGDKRVGILYTDAYLAVHARAQMNSDDGWIRDIFVLRPEALCSVLNEWHAAMGGVVSAKLI